MEGRLRRVGCCILRRWLAARRRPQPVGVSLAGRFRIVGCCRFHLRLAEGSRPQAAVARLIAGRLEVGMVEPLYRKAAKGEEESWQETAAARVKGQK